VTRARNGKNVMLHKAKATGYNMCGYV